MMVGFAAFVGAVLYCSAGCSPSLQVTSHFGDCDAAGVVVMVVAVVVVGAVAEVGVGVVVVVAVVALKVVVGLA